MKYYEKYLKYKIKYLTEKINFDQQKNIKGGSIHKKKQLLAALGNNLEKILNSASDSESIISKLSEEEEPGETKVSPPLVEKKTEKEKTEEKKTEEEKTEKARDDTDDDDTDDDEESEDDESEEDDEESEEDDEEGDEKSEEDDEKSEEDDEKSEKRNNKKGGGNDIDKYMYELRKNLKKKEYNISKNLK